MLPRPPVPAVPAARNPDVDHFVPPEPPPLPRIGPPAMVGFTLLSQHLSDEELAVVVRRFEELSHDIVVAARGRVVKMIGDEVMFVVNDVADAARIGLDLADAYADDELGIELLCTRAGHGALTVDGRALGLKGAKPLPSSD